MSTIAGGRIAGGIIAGDTNLSGVVSYADQLATSTATISQPFTGATVTAARIECTIKG